MRISAYITVSGGRTLTRMLRPGMEKLADVSPDGEFDEAAARRALADVPGVTQSSDDCRSVYAFALQAIDFAHDLLRQLSDRRDNSTVATCRDDDHCERKMDRGKNAFARIDIAWRSNRLRVRIEGGNPHGLVGRVEQEIREACVFFAYVCLLIRDGVSNPDMINIVEGAFAEGAIEDARRHMRENVLWHKAASCPNRRGEYCSPADPSCGCYSCGRCTWKSDS